MMKQLKTEIREKVENAISTKKSTEIANIRVTVIDAGGNQVTVLVDNELIGRFFTNEYQYISSTAIAVLDAVKGQYREAGLEAALAAVRGS